jgi:hypothetical protein
VITQVTEDRPAADVSAPPGASEEQLQDHKAIRHLRRCGWAVEQVNDWVRGTPVDIGGGRRGERAGERLVAISGREPRPSTS